MFLSTRVRACVLTLAVCWSSISGDSVQKAAGAEPPAPKDVNWTFGQRLEKVEQRLDTIENRLSGLEQRTFGRSVPSPASVGTPGCDCPCNDRTKATQAVTPVVAYTYPQPVQSVFAADPFTGGQVFTGSGCVGGNCSAVPQRQGLFGRRR